MMEFTDNKAESISAAISALKDNGIICIPTDTVYGIIADASSDQAISKIYSAKKRDEKKPVQILCSSIEQAYELGIFHDHAKKIAQQYWPGALTIIVHARNINHLSPLAISDEKKIGIRIPSHHIPLEIMKQSGMILSASSANLSGNNSIAKAEDLEEDILQFADYVIRANKDVSGIDSTVIDCSKDGEMKILRQGSIVI